MNKKDAELSDYVFGKVQPQALPLEEAVLGALMLDRDVVGTVAEILKADDFYADAHQLIFKAILSLFRKSRPVDLLTVTEELKKSGDLDAIGGGYYLVEMTNRVGSSANIEYHAAIIKEKSAKRKLIKLGMDLVKSGFEDTEAVAGMMSDAEKRLFSISNEGAKRQAESPAPIMSRLINRLESAKGSNGLTGVPSGFTTLDRRTGGWRDSDLIGLAARPSMGKTGLAVNFMVEAAKMGYPVGFFSLEMSSSQLMTRVLAAEAGIDSKKMMRGQLEDYEWQQLHSCMERVSALPFYIDETPAISIVEARSKCIKMKMQYGIRLFIFDYLQLMVGEKGRNDTREREVASISAALKAIAKELNVPIIALSQLSRASEQRGGSKRPMLSDLRDSGAVEQDLDICMFIHRPEYYGVMEDEDGNSTKGIAEIIFAKHRNGDVGMDELRFQKEQVLFSDKEDFNFHVTAPPMPSPPPSVLITPEKRSEDETIPF